MQSNTFGTQSFVPEVAVTGVPYNAEDYMLNIMLRGSTYYYYYYSRKQADDDT